MTPPAASGVGTLRVGLDPISQIRTLQTTQSRCSACLSHPHLGNSLPHLRLRQLSFSSAAIRHDVFHHLPFDSSSPRESSGSRTPATPPVSCLARHFTLFTRSLHIPRPDWLFWRFGQYRSPFTPVHALHVEVVDIMSSAVISLSGCVAFLVCFRHSS